MIVFSEERLIKASAQQVYDVLVDFSSYEKWNPWIHYAEKLPNGDVLVKTTMKGKEKVFRHRILSESPPNVFHWCDLGWFTKLAFGQRIRHIEVKDDESCVYRCELRVEGFAESLVDRLYGAFMKDGLPQEADALQQYSQSLVLGVSNFIK